MKPALCLSLCFCLAAQISAITYEEAKEALTTLERLNAEKLLSEDEYRKQRQAVILSIGGEDKMTRKPNEKPRKTFEHRFFTASLKKLSSFKDGDVTVVLEFVKPAGDFDVALRLNDNVTGRPESDAEAVPEFQRLPITLTSENGVVYRLVDASGIGYYSLSSGPDPLSPTTPTTATFRFRRMGREKSAVTPSFSLDAELCMFVRVEANAGWKREARVTVHFDDLKFEK